jgi:hypothetical protein
MSGPHNVPPSGYDTLRKHFEAMERAGIKPGHGEGESQGGFHSGEPNDGDFDPMQRQPWGFKRERWQRLMGDPKNKDKNTKDMEEDALLRPRREPGSLLRASDQRMAQALKHEITGSASLHVKLAAGLAPVSGIKTKGELFKEVRMDRAPLTLASTTG